MEDKSAHLVACIPRLRRYARALLGNRAAADDLVQDTMERGWSKLSSWRPGSDMRAWLFGIMHNLYIDQSRKALLPTEALDEQTPEPAVNATQMVGLEIRDMESALRMLPAEQREILLLVALEEMSYEDIGATLGIPIGTVMSRLSRGRERLRAIMEGRPLVTPLKVVK
ncbi:RNA polymerase sigma factor [Herbaspirillum sp. GCM10030257]|uniref:RNA polymerase sigma factor n=1 Tax=Herbaspirillum sp. GCM10030257 TaxID=3273393 RepID=UPI003608072C